MRPILEVAKDKLGIPAEDLIPYGHYKAKVSLDYIASLKGKPDGKLILVTAITPTPAGEGKTTTTVGLGDALNEIGKKAIICLREPSLGPCFGVKGGAAGGGYRPGRADGGHQPPFHRRLPCHRRRQQPARGADRQSCLLGQQARHRHPPRHLAPRRRHERPGAALDRHLARRRRQRLPARRRASTSPSPPRSWRSSASRRTSPICSGGSARSSIGQTRDKKAVTAKDLSAPARWRRCSRMRWRPIWCRRWRTTRPSSMAARSPISPMAATR